jgi:hypothetical protein
MEMDGPEWVRIAEYDNTFGGPRPSAVVHA